MPPDTHNGRPTQGRPPRGNNRDDHQGHGGGGHSIAPEADRLIKAAEELLGMVGAHARNALAETTELLAEARRKAEVMPSPPDLEADLAFVAEVADDARTLRTLAAQAMFELAVERERHRELEARVEALERRPRLVREGGGRS